MLKFRKSFKRSMTTPKQILNLRRREVTLNSNTGEDSVDTEKFRFEITTGQSNANPGEAYVQREIVLRVAPSDLPDDFDDIFPEAVDGIVVPFTGSGEFYEDLADALEAIERAGGGKFVEKKKSEVLTLTLNDGSGLRFNTKRMTMTITPFRRRPRPRKVRRSCPFLRRSHKGGRGPRALRRLSLPR